MAVGAIVAVMVVASRVPWLVAYPENWEIPLRYWVSDFMKWLINDFDLGLFTFRQFTRSIAWLLNWPLVSAQGLLATGFELEIGDSAIDLPRLSWLGVIAAVTVLAHAAGGWRLSVLVATCFGYLAVFGQWSSGMITLSSILIAVPLGAVGGLLFGILGYRSARMERGLLPVLDLMQTVPVFAYLVPVLFLFGFGPVAAMIATIIYATPPMARVTMLALKLVSTEVVEFGRMVGCSRWQMMWKILIPSAKPTLMVGVNQVIMLSLNMVIIASMIGAGGLGFDVLSALKRLRIGDGIEAGLAITLLAIALDRVSQGFTHRAQPAHKEQPKRFVARNPHLVMALAAIVLATLGALFIRGLEAFPESPRISTNEFWSGLVTWINVNFFDQLDAFKNFLLLNFLIPVKRFMLSLPWSVVVGLVALTGYRLGGWRLALAVGCYVAFMAVTGNWEKSMSSVYLCGVSVIIACLIGIPIGVVAARRERAHRVVQVCIDTLQTLPSFVYLIPVVILFRVGDFSAMIAVVAYALTPAIRYTDHGIRQVPAPLIEAATAAGCSQRQMLWKVQLPIAVPEIMLGINQTIMMALSMLVITALVGTRELGQEVYIALTKADTGRGIVAGLCVAFIAMTSDRLISAWSARRKRQLGLA